MSFNKSIKDDDSPDNEIGVFTLSVVKNQIEIKLQLSQKRNKCLEAQCDDDLSFRRQEV
jgi:hypothetical protein